MTMIIGSQEHSSSNPNVRLLLLPLAAGYKTPKRELLLKGDVIELGDKYYFTIRNNCFS